MIQTKNSPKSMRVWLDNQEIERPIDRFETKERKLFGGCPEVVKLPVPLLEAGETVVRWRNRVLIVKQSGEQSGSLQARHHPSPAQGTSVLP